MMNSLLEQTGASSEYYSFFDAVKRKAIIHAMCNAYYSDVSSKQVVFDTNRMWTARLHQLIELFPDFKMICCVRNPAWIADSFELIYRRHAFDYSRMFNPNQRATVYSRCETLMATNGAIGHALTSLKEAYYSEFSSRLLLLDYDLLAQFPERCMTLLYQFLEEKEYKHDFKIVKYNESEFDKQLGIDGLHEVQEKVEFKPRRSILPPDLFDKYKELAFWTDKKGTAANIIGQT
ncbi:hypothetical protein D210916BOD24_34060 [Alteromonas sp. D210916BOD_24]